ncbi:unnamed protein product [Phytophthora lilii]|uniref:Unnamed protein product n=1 Tax=Phytophthora lilii TaxID=2077276 RepID=A0A9W6U9H8_9STRA|nr:unnamed protein product [Phytophthora lilii]
MNTKEVDMTPSSPNCSVLVYAWLLKDPRSRPSAQQVLVHPWLREQSQKRALPPSGGRRKSLPRSQKQSLPPHPRTSCRSPEKLREHCRDAVIRSMKEEELLLSSSSSSIPAVYAPRRRRNLGDSRACNTKKREFFEAPRRVFSRRQSMGFAHANSSDSSSSSDPESINPSDDYSDLSELSMSTSFNARDEQDARNKDIGTDDQTEVESLLDASRSAVSVIMHLKLDDVSSLGLFRSKEDNPGNSKVELQWSCKEPTEIGSPPTFELKVSNGWGADYDPASGVVTAITPEGDPLRYEISGGSEARIGSSTTSTSSRTSATCFTKHPHLPTLVRFCQCLALRTMQLRQIALRGQANKLPFIHFDTLPESLLASFRYRSSLVSKLSQTAISPNPSLSEKAATEDQRSVTIAGVGRGSIAATGDLRVVYLDGSQLTLAASGLQLRFRPSWANACNSDDGSKEDVFELLTASSMSAFLPSVVKQKLESIPEFIRRLKAAS